MKECNFEKGIMYLFFGYILFDLSSSDQVGGDNKFDLMISNLTFMDIKTSLKFKLGDITIHIHHWLICMVFGIIFYYLEQYELMYISFGGIVQGITRYNDWKYIIY